MPLKSVARMGIDDQIKPAMPYAHSGTPSSAWLGMIPRANVSCVRPDGVKLLCHSD